MAKKRDFLDDIIDIQSDWKAMQNPMEGLGNALMGQPEKDTTPIWAPSDYKERPRANTIPCVSCQARDDKLCHRCMDVCPVFAIEIDEASLEISDTCRKCGLCVAACPTDSFVTSKIGAKKLYDRIAGAATSHERAYVTCTRALGRVPEENEVVLPCVGAVPPEVWFAVLCDYDNVSVYLPLGICDKCRTTTGEAAYMDAISKAEEWSECAVALEVDEASLDHKVRREWQRKEFINGIAKAGTQAMGHASRMASAVSAVAANLERHTKQINALEVTLDKACGTTTQRRHRILTQKRQLVLTALQRNPRLAVHFEATRPACDSSRCTLCGECVRLCPTHAIDLTNDGIFKVETTYCVDCGACENACKPKAITMQRLPGDELVVPDEGAEERAKQEAKQKAEVAKLKAEGRKQLDRGLDFLEKLDE
jgi:ferredoxin